MKKQTKAQQRNTFKYKPLNLPQHPQRQEAADKALQYLVACKHNLSVPVKMVPPAALYTRVLKPTNRAIAETISLLLSTFFTPPALALVTDDKEEPCTRQGVLASIIHQPS